MLAQEVEKIQTDEILNCFKENGAIVVPKKKPLNSIKRLEELQALAATSNRACIGQQINSGVFCSILDNHKVDLFAVLPRRGYNVHIELKDQKGSGTASEKLAHEYVYLSERIYRTETARGYLICGDELYNRATRAIDQLMGHAAGFSDQRVFVLIQSHFISLIPELVK